MMDDVESSNSLQPNPLPAGRLDEGERVSQPPPLPPPPMPVCTSAAMPWMMPRPLRSRIGVLYLLMAVLNAIFYMEFDRFLSDTDWLANAIRWDPSGFIGIPLALFGAGFVWGLSWYCALCAWGFLAAGIASACFGSVVVQRCLAIFVCCMPPVGTVVGCVVARAVFRIPRPTPKRPVASEPDIALPLPSAQ